MLGELEAGKEEIDRLKKFNSLIFIHIESLYQIQQEIILNIKNNVSTISLIYERLDELDRFIWEKKMNFNNNNSKIYYLDNYDEYCKNLDEMIINSFLPKIESLIELNHKILGIKSKNKKG